MEEPNLLEFVETRLTCEELRRRWIGAFVRSCPPR